MAEFLIFARDVVNPDPEKDKGCPKRGDIIDVREDGFEWGKKERLPDFYFIKIPGLSVTGTAQYKFPEGGIIGQASPNVVLKFRLWKTNVDVVPSAIKNTLLSTGKVTVNWSQIKSYIVNKKDGGTAG